MTRRSLQIPALVVFAFAVAAVHPTRAQDPRATDTPRSEHDIEVMATGCLSGDTLVETNLNRNPSNGAVNPARRWRLRVTSSQRQLLKELDPTRQVEIWGVTDRRELESATVGKSVRVGRGRAYFGTESSRTPANEPVIAPVLVVEHVKQTQDRCR